MNPDSFSDPSFSHQPVSVIIFLSSECCPLSVHMLCLSITCSPARTMAVVAGSVPAQTMPACPHGDSTVPQKWTVWGPLEKHGKHTRQNNAQVPAQVCTPKISQTPTQMTQQQQCRWIPIRN